MAHPKTAKTTHLPASASVPGGGVRALELLKLLNPFLVASPPCADRAPASTTDFQLLKTPPAPADAAQRRLR